MFKTVSPKVDFPEMERNLLEKWYNTGIVEKYLHLNDVADKQFSFLDGPITANNPMGVHHAWGRTYKDFWQRFWNMRGYRQRFQNGFDEQGLWVEVEVEKELGLKSKKDIENLVPGDKFKSLEKFINLCKERVVKFSQIQTEQSKRLGYFMDWDNSYHTSSDKNNYTIWHFLQVVNEKGWLYKGRDSVPWCPRCGTAISQHEILTEEYKELTHTSVFFKLPLVDEEKKYLLVWTTTPWTIPANVAVAVDPNLDYAEVAVEGATYIVADAVSQNILPEGKKTKVFKGSELVGKKYTAPFDNLPAVQQSLGSYEHRIIATDPLILPIVTEEGTGLVHIAPGAGTQDFALGKKEELPVIAPIDEAGIYVEGFGAFTGLHTKKVTEGVIEYLQEHDFLLKAEKYTHRYPTCWRCKTELVWRVVDEWYIAMDKKDESGKTYREQMIEVAKEITWMPSWGLDRELDWLKNMHDWLISKKRYWGLALPIWECNDCHHFMVIGGKEELKEKAVEGWESFEGNSPHRPWVDQIKIKCDECGGIATRIPDVGNPWLDAGIVPFSTMPSEWFPADFITESFPGQFKNWFYALIAMSTALKSTNPFKRVLGFGSVRDEKGEEMHKSKGNAIEFNEAADKIGVDVMRWLYLRTNPEHNVSFGYHVTDEIRRLFYLRLWNVYSFFVMYANVDGWEAQKDKPFTPSKVLDKWILSRLNHSVEVVTDLVASYNAQEATKEVEHFIIDELSNWYVRRIRDRVGPSAIQGKDKDDAYTTLWIVLTTYARLLAPFMPFIADEIYTNLTGEESVHIVQWPEVNNELIDTKLEQEMAYAIELASAAHELRRESGVKVKIPLKTLSYNGPAQLSEEVIKIVQEETNVYNLVYEKKQDVFSVTGSTDVENQDLVAGQVRDIIRKIQQERKILGTTFSEKVDVYLPEWPEGKEEDIKKGALVDSMMKSEEFKVVRKNA